MTRKRHRDVYRFIDFVRPDHGYFPHNYSIDQAFGLYAWMCHTGCDEKYEDKGRWGTATVACLLQDKSSCIGGFYHLEPIINLDDLKRRLRAAILEEVSLNGCYGRWRADNGIDFRGEREIQFPHYRRYKGPVCDAAICEAYLRLCEPSRLKVQLNRFQKRAVHGRGVRVGWCGDHRFQIALRYGYARDSSEWGHVLATQQMKESFVDVLLRASTAMEDLRK